MGRAEVGRNWRRQPKGAGQSIMVSQMAPFRENQFMPGFL
jgi:hypothetical protein